MNIDDYLNSLQSELENSFNDFSQNRQQATNNESLNTYTQPITIYCPECGTRINSGANFCPNCGHSFSDRNEYTLINEGNEMIIFTNTFELSRKYNIDQNRVLKVFEYFIKANEELGITCHLLDVNDSYNLGEGTWMDYSDIVQEFCKTNNILTGPSLSLFIVGGNDVIPQPCEDNPAFMPSPYSNNDYSERVYADFFYCFYGKISLDYLDYNKARCNVARLPLEMGQMHTTIEDDILGYFKRSINASKKDGIEIGRAVMTSNSDWIPASREMSRNLPTESMNNSENEVLDNMYISPMIMVDMKEELAGKYYSSLNKADMLVFNLHGSCDPRMSGFYSNGHAFSIEMLQKSNAKIFNTVACWGGRYIKYKREQSMLMNAIYNGGVLLYCGSCVPALGKCGNYQSDSTWRIQPAAYSETFMGRFAEYQCLGTLTAGEAILKAKCDYYNSSRMIEEDEYILGTVLMFNLYGNPTLRTTPDINALSQIQSLDGSKMYRIPFRKLNREVVMKNEDKEQNNSQSNSVLDAVRSAVDSNLRLLHEGIVKNLYNQLGVEPRELFCVERYQTTDANGNRKNGYLYNYGREKDNLRTHIRVKLDERGNLLDAIQTK
ncbi:MAG: zinc ribbon domain-containing protein [Bacteroidaceae bacterium]|nr:zinc ribbon domain-containing protein [Bacteroidaceae bacterium]